MTPKSVKPNFKKKAAKAIQNNWPSALLITVVGGILLANNQAGFSVIQSGINNANEQLKEVRAVLSEKVDKKDCRYEMEQHISCWHIDHTKCLPKP